ELAADYHAEHDKRKDRANAIDEQTRPGPLGLVPGLADHARLRRRECDKDANRVERQKGLGFAVEWDENDDREQRQDDDSVVIGKAVAQRGKLARQESIGRQDGGEARESRERRIRRQQEN